MAHRIFTHDKQQGLKQAWHGLTEIVPSISLDDNWLTQWDLVPVTLQKAGVDTKWTVLECSDDRSIEIGQPYNPGSFQPVDNKAFLELIRDSISGTPHKVTSVGSVRNRGRVFVSIELHGMEAFKAAGRDFGAYLNFGNGHDKSSVLWVNTSNVCTVCDNTFTSNLLEVENKAGADVDDNIRLNQRHTKNVKMKLPEIAKLVDKAVGVQAEFQRELDKAHAEKITIDGATQLFAGFLGRGIDDATKGLSTRAINTVARLGVLFTSGKGNRGETMADAFSAVTDYYSHESSGKGGNVFKQVISSEFGSGNVAKRSFWNVITNEAMVDATMEHGELLLKHTSN